LLLFFLIIKKIEKINDILLYIIYFLLTKLLDRLINMTERLINHTLDNIYSFDDNVKSIIKQFYVPKHINIDVNIIYPEYRHLFPERISTNNLKKTLLGVLRHYKRELKITNIRHSSVFAATSAYLQSIGLKQGLDKYDFEYACARGGVIGMYYDDSHNFHYLTILGIIHELVGNELEY
jgi:hypothetical protein